MGWGEGGGLRCSSLIKECEGRVQVNYVGEGDEYVERANGL